MALTPSAGWVERYLGLLGVERAAPSLPSLGRLIRAHLAAVPFENVTSILRRNGCPGSGPVPVVDPEEQLQIWEARAGGGVCFEVAEMFSSLLVGLGYRAYPVLGRIVLPGRTPWLGAHQGIIVDLDGRRYLVDAGNGAPFFDAVPVDVVTEVRRHGLAYRFHPDEPGRLSQDRLSDDGWSSFCSYDLWQPEVDARTAAFQRHHQLDQSWVASSLFMIRCADDAVHVVRDGTWTRYMDAGKETVALTSDDEYVRLASDVFGLPALPIERALRVLVERGGV